MKEESDMRVENKESREPLAKSIMVLLQFKKIVFVALYVSLFSCIFPPNNW